MTELRGSAAQFYQQVAQALPYPRRDKTRYLDMLQGELADFCETHNNPTEAQLHEQFGTPDEIAAECLVNDAVPLSWHMAAQRRNRKILLTLGICLIVIFAFIAGLAIRYFKDNQDILNGVFIESVREGEEAEAYIEQLDENAIEVH